MGRGRAKAKEKRVARTLKYQSPTVNLDRLRADLCSEHPQQGEGEPDPDSPEPERGARPE